MKKNILLFLILAFLYITGFSQIKHSYTINWNSKSNNAGAFPEADYLINDTSLPVFIKTIELGKDIACKDMSLKVLSSEICNDTAIVNNISNYDVRFEWAAGFTKKSSLCEFTLHPYYIDDISNRCYIITSFEVIIETENRIQAQRNLPTQSILSTGEWYRFMVVEEGMYCITYDDLKNYGVNINNVKSENIRIFAKKGYILPEANKDALVDNQPEIPIQIFDGNDGIFNAGDSIVFYVEGPHSWEYDSQERVFNHKYNFYSDTAHFLLNISDKPGKRIEKEDIPTHIPSPITSISNYMKLDFFEEESVNVNQSGNAWYGKPFDSNSTYTVPKLFLIPELADDSIDSSALIYNIMCSSDSVNYVNAIINDSPYEVQMIRRKLNKLFGRQKMVIHKFNANKSQIEIKFKYSTNDSYGKAYIDYINLNLNSKLQYTGTQFSFRNPTGKQEDKVVKYLITKSSDDLNVWHITNPLNPTIIQTEQFQDTTAFYFYPARLAPDVFIAFYKKDLKKPIFDKQIPNQNLFALTDVDYLLIVPDGKFIEQAKLFGELNRENNGHKYAVVELNEIYNEFSCGTRDITSIRNLIRYMYLSSNGQYPKNVLLFGTTSYDYKNITTNNPNLMPSFESYESLDENNSYVTDDYYVKMDEEEGANGEGIIDIPIGRIPFDNEADIDTYFKKVKHYAEVHASPNGTWKSKFIGVADDGTTPGESADNRYPLYIEGLVDDLNNLNNNLLFDKVYIDAFEHKYSTGIACPDATNYLINKFDEGALMIMYYGHGSKLGWAGENLFTTPSVKQIDNLDNMPMVIAITCDYFEYDKPDYYPSAKHLIRSPKGGASSLICTSRISYGVVCFTAMDKIIELLREDVIDGNLTAGKIFFEAKQNSISHTRSVHLFGDPLMKMNYPDYKINIQEINNQEINNDIEHDIEFKNADLINVEGEINYNQKFSGLLNYELYDQPSKYVTFGHDDNTVMEFYIRDRLINKGTVEVVDNEFSIEFRLPANLNGGDSTLKLQLYAYDTINNITAIGSYSNIIHKRENANYNDSEPPTINAYIDHVGFKDYDMVSKDATLFIFLHDESGLDVCGSNIGKHISFVLNDDFSTYEILDPYYVCDLNTYKSGHIKYELKNLPVGLNYITINAYDVIGNYSSRTIHFSVAENIMPVIMSVSAIPNPPIDYSTNICITHNLKNQKFDLQIELHHISGKKVYEIKEAIDAKSNETCFLWDCKNNNGRLVDPGLYIYTVTISSDEIRKTKISDKILIKQ